MQKLHYISTILVSRYAASRNDNAVVVIVSYRAALAGILNGLDGT